MYRRGNAGSARYPGPRPSDRARPRDGAVLRGYPPLRAVVGPEAHRRAAVRGADQTHPVVGPADADLGCTRACRDSLGAQSDADHDVAAQLLPASVGALGLITLVGWRRHRVCQQPGDDVPAVAHRRAAVSLSEVGGVRRFRVRPEEDRHHRPYGRNPLGYKTTPIWAPWRCGSAMACPTYESSARWSR